MTIRPEITGKQRLRDIRTRVQITARRQVEEFMAGKIDILPCSGDHEDELIAAEFERLTSQDMAKNT